MVKAIVMGIVVLMAGCAHRPAPDCEAHLVPIQVPALPAVEPVAEPPIEPMPVPTVPEPHL